MQDGRPEARPTRPEVDGSAAWAAVVLAGLTVWVLWPLWPSVGDVVLGDAQTDAVRGMWGLDHLRASMIPPETPLWTDRVNAPEGALVLVLPWISGQLLAPLGWLFGAQTAWNLALATLLWAAGMGTAWLVRQLSDSWWAGIVAGAAVLAQPMLLHALGDGTAEHVAIWSLPLFLGATATALRTTSPRWGLLTGLAAALVAFDSPYLAVYAMVTALVALPWPLLGVVRWPHPKRLELVWMTVSGLVVVGLAGAALGSLYSQFDLSQASATDQLREWRANATDLYVWWLHDWGDRTVRDPSLAPCLIPAPVLLGGLVLALVGLPRSLPWVLSALVMVGLSLGLNQQNPVTLAGWVGDGGWKVGNGLMQLNAYLYALPGISSVRFPSRWLVPAALALSVAGGLGLATLFRSLGPLRRLRAPLALFLAAGAVASGLGASDLHSNFPMHTLPQVAFADWIADRPGTGTAIHLPTVRPAPESGMRASVPVFAELGEELASADLPYLQTLHGRPVVGYPSLQTVAPRDLSPAVYGFLRDWNDLAAPVLSGTQVPSSAVDERFEERRSHIRDLLIDAGLRWVVVDSAAYGDESLDILRTQLGTRVALEQHFDDGTGVVVFELSRPTTPD